MLVLSLVVRRLVVGRAVFRRVVVRRVVGRRVVNRQKVVGRVVWRVALCGCLGVGGLVIVCGGCKASR